MRGPSPAVIEGIQVDTGDGFADNPTQGGLSPPSCSTIRSTACSTAPTSLRGSLRRLYGLNGPPSTGCATGRGGRAAGRTTRIIPI
jgi:hypothetical protein